MKGILAQILKSNELSQHYLTPRDSDAQDLEQLAAPAPPPRRETGPEEIG